MPHHRWPQQHWMQWLLCLLLAWGLMGCGARLDDSEDYQPQFSTQPEHQGLQRTVRVGIHPLHNPALLFERYGPIVARLNARIPQARFTLEAEEKLAQRQLDIALPNPYQTLQALRYGYRIFGKMGDDAMFRGVVLVRADSAVHHPRDLRGKAISFPSPTALAATLQPQLALHQQGLPFGSYEARYVGSQESSIMSVVLGHTAAGATWPAPWQSFQHTQPELAAQLRVLLETPPLVNNALIAKDDLPAPLLDAIAQVFLTLHTDATGQTLLAALPVSRFERASAQTYEPVRRFLADYARQIHPLAPEATPPDALEQP